MKEDFSNNYEEYIPEVKPKKPLWKKLLIAFTIFIFILLFAFAVEFVSRINTYISDIQEGELDFENQQSKLSSQLAKDIGREENKSISELRKEIETLSDPTFGIKDAKVVVVEFGDFQCPFTRQMYPVVKKIQSEFEDRVLFIWRDLPLYDIHPDAINAAIAGECAREQGKFWEMHDMMFINQEDLSRSALIKYARDVGLNVNRFKRCLDTEKYRNEVMDDFQTAVKHGAEGTPTFFINGEKISGAIPYEVFRDIINSKLINR